MRRLAPVLLTTAGLLVALDIAGALAGSWLERRRTLRSSSGVVSR